MRFTGVPAASHGVDDRRLADRQPLADDASPTTTCWSGSPAWTPPGCRRWCRPGRSIGPVLPEVAADLGIPASAVAVTGLPDLHSAAVGAGAIELGQPHASIGTTAWISAPVPRKKTDVLRQQASVPGLDNASYLLANNQDSAGRNLQWWRDAGGARPSVRRPARRGRRATPPGAGGVHLHAVADRRALAGRRPQRPGRLPRRRRGRHPRRPDPRGARGRRRSTPLAARRRREVRRHPARRHPAGRRRRAVGPLVPGARRRHRPHHRAGHRPVAGRPARRRAVRRRWRSAHSTGEVRGLVPTDEPFRPDPRHRATYDALVAELPKLYAAQRGFFRRRPRAPDGRGTPTGNLDPCGRTRLRHRDQAAPGDDEHDRPGARPRRHAPRDRRPRRAGRRAGPLGRPGQRHPGHRPALGLQGELDRFSDLESRIDDLGALVELGQEDDDAASLAEAEAELVQGQEGRRGARGPHPAVGRVRRPRGRDHRSARAPVASTRPTSPRC